MTRRPASEAVQQGMEVHVPPETPKKLKDLATTRDERLFHPAALGDCSHAACR